ncbi:hypothetical protein KZO01_18420 [Kurthia zopfii]|uniref:Uncharacterized protein n=1 Tax=Kurthia zopfii TaxID=1650 RepID=A0A8B4QDF3_9BACL|nr:hypothetical protein [Kurthia zopfii]TDR38809.1 hypothetical protein DFR61_11428 [Kurthia zopfii]GEK31533.1 hypothetical protein KZO01_18420 [Kurthia zopfii]STX10715.1 Uncharacterised protein [Kurthia zopfii]
MGLYVVTIIGYMAAILGVGALFVHYLRVGLDSKQSEIVDPKPTTKY